MRVVHVSDVFLPRLGGIETQVAGLAAAQRRAGIDARVVTTTPADRTVDHSVDDTAAVTRLHARGLLTPRRVVRAVAATVRLVQTEPVDIAHVHLSLASIFSLGVLQALARAHVPTVVTMHSMWDGVPAIPHPLIRPVGMDRWPVLWTAVSQAAAESASRVLGDQTPVQVLPNATDPQSWHRIAERRRPGAGGPLRVASMMRLTARKRPLPLVDLLGDAIDQGVDVRAVIGGEGPQQHALRRRIERRGQADRIVLPGRLDGDGVGMALARADLYLCPTVLESFGIAALEARFAGLPVVARSGSGVADFVTSGVDGLLVDSDRAITAALVELAADRDRLASMTRIASSQPPPFSWADVLPRTEHVYAEARHLVRPARSSAPSVDRPAGTTHRLLSERS